MLIAAVCVVIAAYLIGSVNFAVIFSSVFLKKDVRKLGSGNAGTTNVMRTAGFLPGALTFVFDALKGFAACYAGKAVFDFISQRTDALWAVPVYGAYLCGIACMLGHIFPIFFQFRGGKGVATSVGIYAVCCPPAIVIGLVVFILVVLITRYVSLGSVLAAVAVIISSAVFYNHSGMIIPQAVLSACMGSTVIIKHKENIKRLIAGNESKFHIRRH